MEAREGIATLLAGRYPNDPRIRQAIPVVQQIYQDNFFPEMKASWNVYPDNIGHMIWPGCFRCHDGKHKSEDGPDRQGQRLQRLPHHPGAGQRRRVAATLARRQQFKHPGGDYDLTCYDCHNGGL